MKERLVRFILGLLYVFLVAALLLMHVQNIAGTLQRTLATVETLLLAVPIVVILIFYIRIQDKINRTQQRKEEEHQTVSLEAFTAYAMRYALSKREIEVAWMLYKGYTNQQMAQELYIAESTVKKHVSHIYEKMEVSGRKYYKEKVGKEINNKK